VPIQSVDSSVKVPVEISWMKTRIAVIGDPLLLGGSH
jgi:hypothetical protein